jgi:hypothetical protein
VSESTKSVIVTRVGGGVGTGVWTLLDAPKHFTDQTLTVEVPRRAAREMTMCRMVMRKGV